MREYHPTTRHTSHSTRRCHDLGESYVASEPTGDNATKAADTITKQQASTQGNYKAAGLGPLVPPGPRIARDFSRMRDSQPKRTTEAFFACLTASPHGSHLPEVRGDVTRLVSDQDARSDHLGSCCSALATCANGAQQISEVLGNVRLEKLATDSTSPVVRCLYLLHPCHA